MVSAGKMRQNYRDKINKFITILTLKKHDQATTVMKNKIKYCNNLWSWSAQHINPEENSHSPGSRQQTPQLSPCQDKALWHWLSSPQLKYYHSWLLSGASCSLAPLEGGLYRDREEQHSKPTQQNYSWPAKHVTQLHFIMRPCGCGVTSSHVSIGFSQLVIEGCI